ncbi:hypothetical protein [Peptostreptococcus faecalis]|uniref:hypothetical protein n=1 Tax=Peptostreptococcus faecalis TaxID=2045015 RepID=UPI000C7D76D3|nr:hypothetical protein [Peptostreptococcus faecalis]
MWMLNKRAELVKGIAIGVGVCAVGYVAYKKNEDAVNSFLNEHGFNISSENNSDFYSMSLEELMEAKETIEDIIAEKDLTGVTIVSTEE